MGCDLQPGKVLQIRVHFNPRTPRGVRLWALSKEGRKSVFQSTHPSWGATQSHPNVYRQQSISIHAPLVGCDMKPTTFCHGPTNFNPRTPRGVRHVLIDKVFCINLISIHAPLVGCDYGIKSVYQDGGLFQSTHPSWGATPSWMRGRSGSLYFNPRTPRGVRPHTTSRFTTFQTISIHAPLVGCDCQSGRTEFFQPDHFVCAKQDFISNPAAFHHLNSLCLLSLRAHKIIGAAGS